MLEGDCEGEADNVSTGGDSIPSDGEGSLTSTSGQQESDEEREVDSPTASPSCSENDIESTAPSTLTRSRLTKVPSSDTKVAVETTTSSELPSSLVTTV